jgi:hypothetical protein
MEDDGKYNHWFNVNFKNNAILFAETKDDEFDEFCFSRYISPKDINED